MKRQSRVGKEQPHEKPACPHLLPITIANAKQAGGIFIVCMHHDCNIAARLQPLMQASGAMSVLPCENDTFTSTRSQSMGRICHWQSWQVLGKGLCIELHQVVYDHIKLLHRLYRVDASTENVRAGTPITDSNTGIQLSSCVTHNVSLIYYTHKCM